LNDGVLSVWAKVLESIPSARLRIQNEALSRADGRARFRARLIEHGIDQGRVDLHGSMPREAYLKAFGEIDILLDTFPYCGGTTTCEALWMGVPTVTLAGNALISRQGAGLMSAAGLE